MEKSVEKNGSPVWPNIDSVDMTKFDFGTGTWSDTDDDCFNPQLVLAVEALEEIASASEQANPISLINIAKEALRG